MQVFLSCLHVNNHVSCHNRPTIQAMSLISIRKAHKGARSGILCSGLLGAVRSLQRNRMGARESHDGKGESLPSLLMSVDSWRNCDLIFFSGMH